jgi:hypothetical protein
MADTAAAAETKFTEYIPTAPVAGGAGWSVFTTTEAESSSVAVVIKPHLEEI